ncbi:Ribonuclease H-like superfamily protein [Rhynchospora pubera]|uniref:Ribonuclease H-like superfamily protein n=1 Tax=Rhynchospora pubera TaxID=906938 RepID=A0AAV8C863_9POAL|nr:Ribonuclease H-like superfamily protein [Rhynchospora pubera]
MAPSLLQKVRKPEKRPGMRDMLIWDCTKSGRYTVKDGYECSIMRMNVQGGIISWKYIWNWKNVVPKVKLFIWRLLSNALPLAQNLSNRIHAISPTCQRCHQENEFATHCFFFCQGSRMVWFAGELGIRTHDLPLDMVLAVEQLVQGMNEDQIPTFCYTLWEIWLARNEAILHHKPFQPVAVCKKIAAWKKGEYYTEESLQPFQSIVVPHEYLPNGWQIITDASWDTSQKTGVAYLVYYNGILQWVRMVSQEATDSFQAEAMALQEVMAWVKLLVPQNFMQKIQIFSDCLNLIMAAQEGNIFDIPSWKATSIVAELVHDIQTTGADIMLQHVRCEVVKPAHDLANHARRQTISYQGVPTVAFLREHGIGMKLDERFFQQVMEAPP